MREYWIIDPDAASIEIIGADGKAVQRTAAVDDDALTLWPLPGDIAVVPADTED